MAFLKKKNCARTTINQVGGINASITSLIVADATQLPSTGDYLLTIWNRVTFPDPCDDPNQEIIKVINVVGNTLTIERGQEDTVGVAHLNGQAVEMLLTAGTLEEIESAIDLKSDISHAHQASEISTTNSGETVQSKLDSVDSDIASKANTIHNHVASDVTDFQTEVSTNSDVIDSFQKSTDDTDDITEGTTNKFTTTTEINKLSGIEINAKDDQDASEVSTNNSGETVQSKLDSLDANKVDITSLDKRDTNITLNAFRIAINGSLTVFNMVDGIEDVYTDESGIDTDNSTNESYDSGNDLYQPESGESLLIDATDVNNSVAIGQEGGFRTRPAQSFTLSSSKIISRVSLKFGTRTGSPTGNVTVTIETDNSGEPSGTLVHANATTIISPTDSVYNDCNFTDFTLAAGTYWIRAYCDNQSNGVWWRWQFTTSGTYSGGHLDRSRDGGVTWTDYGSGTFDTVFRVYVTSPPSNMTLLSNAFTADVQPDNARIVLFEEDVDSITLNTDLEVWGTRDTGQTFTTDFATDDKLDITGHGFSNDDRILVTSSSQDLPAILDSETIYFVINQTTNDFELSLTSGGAAVDITDDGTGTHTARKVNQGTLLKETDYETGKQILIADFDLSAQPSGTSMRYLVKTLNEKDLKLHGTALSWD